MQSTQTEQNVLQTRRVANHNHCHALTMILRGVAAVSAGKLAATAVVATSQESYRPEERVSLTLLERGLSARHVTIEASRPFGPGFSR